MIEYIWLKYNYWCYCTTELAKTYQCTYLQWTTTRSLCVLYIYWTFRISSIIDINPAVVSLAGGKLSNQPWSWNWVTLWLLPVCKSVKMENNNQLCDIASPIAYNLLSYSIQLIIILENLSTKYSDFWKILKFISLKISHPKVRSYLFILLIQYKCILCR